MKLLLNALIFSSTPSKSNAFRNNQFSHKNSFRAVACITPPKIFHHKPLVCEKNPRHENQFENILRKMPTTTTTTKKIIEINLKLKYSSERDRKTQLNFKQFHFIIM